MDLNVSEVQEWSQIFQELIKGKFQTHTRRKSAPDSETESIMSISDTEFEDLQNTVYREESRESGHQGSLKSVKNHMKGQTKSIRGQRSSNTNLMVKLKFSRGGEMGRRSRFIERWRLNSQRSDSLHTDPDLVAPSSDGRSPPPNLELDKY